MLKLRSKVNLFLVQYLVVQRFIQNSFFSWPVLVS